MVLKWLVSDAPWTPAQRPASGHVFGAKGDGAPDGINLELILEELQDWEELLRDADIDWEALEVEHLDHGNGP